MSAHPITLSFGQKPTKTLKLTVSPNINVQTSDLTQETKQQKLLHCYSVSILDLYYVKVMLTLKIKIRC